MRIANIESLLATKLKAIFNRAAYKDYKDIVEILKTKQSNLNTGITLLRKFVGYEIPTAQILKTLTYFNDGDLHKLNDDDRKILEDSVLQYKFNLQQKCRNYQ